MEWEAIGAIGEIVGALAVVATLAYLAQQVRTQNRATEMASFDGLMDGFNQFNSMLATEEGLYRRFMKGLNNPESLDDDEAGQFTALFRMHINNTHKIFEAYKRGAFPEQLWRDFAAQTAEMWYSPGGQVFAEAHPVHFDFQDAMRKNLRDRTTVDLSLGREKIRRSPGSEG